MEHINIGRCIYCGKIEEKMTDEHIMPFGLGGKVMLLKASCEKCRDITSRCERNPINKEWSEIRAFLNYPSRKRNFSEEIFPLNVELKDGTKKVLNLNREEVMGFTQFLEYNLPGFLKPNPKYKKGVIITGLRTISFKKDGLDFLKKLNVKSFSFSVDHKGNEFEIMVAKIAYCHSVASYGLDCFEKVFVLPSIMREKDDIGMWFGCDLGQQITKEIGIRKSDYVIKLGVLQINNNNYVVVKIKFFAFTVSPEYIVVVGELKKDFDFKNSKLNIN